MKYSQLIWDGVTPTSMAGKVLILENARLQPTKFVPEEGYRHRRPPKSQVIGELAGWVMREPSHRHLGVLGGGWVARGGHAVVLRFPKRIDAADKIIRDFTHLPPALEILVSNSGGEPVGKFLE